MKRSEINSIIEGAVRFFKEMNFNLPPFAFYSIDDWQKVKKQAQEIIDLQLGWDITDFGLGDFFQKGLVLFTLRNGKFQSKEYPKPYCEKIMMVREKQVTPFHYHKNKMEDIINRGGGELIIQLYNSTTDDELDDTTVEVHCDGIKKHVPAGGELALKPGESTTFPSRLYHAFWGEGGNVLVGEVSLTNDDEHDNFFYGSIGRFPEIDEDVKPAYLLCNDYNKFL